MLTVTVYLYGKIVSVIQGVFVTGLYGTADTKVYRKINIMEMIFFADLSGMIFGTVINYNIIKIRSMLGDIAYRLFDTCFFIVSRNDN